MALNIREIATQLANLTVTGVTICDMGSIPSSDQITRSPQMFPEPINFLSDLSINRDSFGDPSAARKTATYTLTYTFVYSEAGLGRDLNDKYPGMVALAADILDAIIGFDDMNQLIDPVVEIVPSIPGAFGVVYEPGGKACLGAIIQLRVTEFIN